MPGAVRAGAPRRDAGAVGARRARGGRGRPRGAPRARARDEVHGVVDPPRGRPAPRPGAPLPRAARPRLRGGGTREVLVACQQLSFRFDDDGNLLPWEGEGPGARVVSCRSTRSPAPGRSRPSPRTRGPSRACGEGRCWRAASAAGSARRRPSPAQARGTARRGASCGSATGAASSPGCRGPLTPGTPRGMP